MNQLAQVTQSSGDIGNPVFKGMLRSYLNASQPTMYFDRILSTLVTLGFIIGAVVFFFMFLSGAIKWITSGGDKVKIEEAQKTLTSALIGLVVLFSLYAIIALLENIFGIDILVLDIGSLRIQ